MSFYSTGSRRKTATACESSIICTKSHCRCSGYSCRSGKPGSAVMGEFPFSALSAKDVPSLRSMILNSPTALDSSLEHQEVNETVTRRLRAVLASALPKNDRVQTELVLLARDVMARCVFCCVPMRRPT